MKVKKIVLEVLKQVNVQVDHKTLRLNPGDIVEIPLVQAGDLVRGGYAKSLTPFPKTIVEGPPLVQEGR